MLLPEAKESSQAMCQFYTEHQQADPARTLAQYVSLALNLNASTGTHAESQRGRPAAGRELRVGVGADLSRSSMAQAGLQAIWTRHQAAYTALTERYHEPLSKMLFDTEVYLKLPSAAYLGRTFTVYLDPMGAPGQANARNYGTDYYVVISPGTGAESGSRWNRSGTLICIIFWIRWR